MNIFVLDSNPVTAAIQQLDKHVVKMPLESAQMLCSALIAHGVEDAPYRKAHPKHPCTLWAAQTRTNFLWLVKHGISLSEEYTRRYGKRHKSQDVIEWCATQADAIPAGELTTFAQAMPEQYKNPDAVTAYRQYYMGEKRNIATWKQNRPAWFV
tara:strand:- start:207 stop:668 length:462 start_codon:yes stop_codon:yes gene_type:complete